MPNFIKGFGYIKKYYTYFFLKQEFLQFSKL